MTFQTLSNHYRPAIAGETRERISDDQEETFIDHTPSNAVSMLRAIPHRFFFLSVLSKQYKFLTPIITNT